MRPERERKSPQKEIPDENPYETRRGENKETEILQRDRPELRMCISSRRHQGVLDHVSGFLSLIAVPEVSRRCTLSASLRGH